MEHTPGKCEFKVNIYCVQPSTSKTSTTIFIAVLQECILLSALALSVAHNSCLTLKNIEERGADFRSMVTFEVIVCGDVALDCIVDFC